MAHDSTSFVSSPLEVTLTSSQKGSWLLRSSFPKLFAHYRLSFSCFQRHLFDFWMFHAFSFPSVIEEKETHFFPQVEKISADGDEEINTLLCGDPSTAKSQLLQLHGQGRAGPCCGAHSQGLLEGLSFGWGNVFCVFAIVLLKIFWNIACFFNGQYCISFVVVCFRNNKDNNKNSNIRMMITSGHQWGYFFTFRSLDEFCIWVANAKSSAWGSMAYLGH